MEFRWNVAMRRKSNYLNKPWTRWRNMIEVICRIFNPLPQPRADAVSRLRTNQIHAWHVGCENFKVKYNSININISRYAYGASICGTVLQTTQLAPWNNRYRDRMKNKKNKIKKHEHKNKGKKQKKHKTQKLIMTTFHRLEVCSTYPSSIKNIPKTITPYHYRN